MIPNHIYERECNGTLTQKECFPIYFDCEDYDCPNYEDCRILSEKNEPKGTY